MAKGTIYKVAFRRRREGRTDYHLRKRLISSRKHRLVIRKTNAQLTLQLVESKIEGDRALVHAGTCELKHFGWRVSTGNLPASYLAGFLLGKRAVAKGFNFAILDLNRYKITRENRLLAAVKGAIDAGLEIPHDEEAIPKSERLSGAHIAHHAEALSKEDPNKYQAYFSGYISAGVAPEKLVEHFEAVKSKMEKEMK